MNARESENYLAISRSFSASKSVEIVWAEIYLGRLFFQGRIQSHSNDKHLCISVQKYLISNGAESTWGQNDLKPFVPYIYFIDKTSSSWDHTQRIVYFECANIEVCSVQALIQQNNSIIITRGIYIFLYSQQHVYRLTTSSLFLIKNLAQCTSVWRCSLQYEQMKKFH